jgi:hypothetical protein
MDWKAHLGKKNNVTDLCDLIGFMVNEGSIIPSHGPRIQGSEI